MDNAAAVIESKDGSSYIGEARFDERFDAQERLAAMVGLRLPKTMVPAGEALWDIGEASKQRLDAEVAALPSFFSGAAALRSRIKAEDAKDFSGTPIQRLTMVPNPETPRPTFSVLGGISDLGYTKTAFGHICDAVKPKGLVGLPGNLLSLSDPWLRAEVFNHHARKAFERNKEPMTLRTIVEPASGLRVLRAVTSGKHSLTSGDDMAILDAMEGQLADSLKAAKLRVTRDLDRTYLEALWPAMKRETRVGDIVLIGVRVRNSETKQGALKVEPFVLDTLCYNFTTAESKGGDEEVIIRHVGDLGPKLAETFVRALKKVDPFIRAFGDAYKTTLPMSRGEMLQRVAKVFELSESTISATAAAWDEQATVHRTAGDSLADLVNAMTKASQEEAMDEAMVTGRAAGTLIQKGLAALEA